MKGFSTTEATRNTSATSWSFMPTARSSASSGPNFQPLRGPKTALRGPKRAPKAPRTPNSPEPSKQAQNVKTGSKPINRTQNGPSQKLRRTRSKIGFFSTTADFRKCCRVFETFRNGSRFFKSPRIFSKLNRDSKRLEVFLKFFKNLKSSRTLSRQTETRRTFFSPLKLFSKPQPAESFLKNFSNAPNFSNFSDELENFFELEAKLKRAEDLNALKVFSQIFQTPKNFLKRNFLKTKNGRKRQKTAPKPQKPGLFEFSKFFDFFQNFSEIFQKPRSSSKVFQISPGFTFSLRFRQLFTFSPKSRQFLKFPQILRNFSKNLESRSTFQNIFQTFQSFQNFSRNFELSPKFSNFFRFFQTFSKSASMFNFFEFSRFFCVFFSFFYKINAFSISCFSLKNAESPLKGTGKMGQNSAQPPRPVPVLSSDLFDQRDGPPIWRGAKPTGLATITPAASSGWLGAHLFCNA